MLIQVNYLHYHLFLFTIILDQFRKVTTHFHLNTIHLFHVQNKYLEMMFTYMIYRYGYIEASMRFSGLLFNALQLSVLTMNASTIEEHNEMLDTVIEDTTHKLSMHDKTVM